MFFISIPKLLFEHEAFKDISYGSKILYSIMLQKFGYIENNENNTDQEGHIFMYYSVEDAMVDMRCKRPSAITMMKQLDEIGLIEIRKRNNKKVVYLKDFSAVQR